MLCYEIITCSLVNKELCQVNKFRNKCRFCLYFIVFYQLYNKQKKFARYKGPGNKSKYRLSLLLFFAYGYDARFFPPKDLVYFFSHTGHNSKRQTFFPKKIFPPRDLVFFTHSWDWPL